MSVWWANRIGVIRLPGQCLSCDTPLSPDAGCGVGNSAGCVIFVCNWLHVGLAADMQCRGAVFVGIMHS